MKIAVLAASGRAGRLITEEALNRGYSVSAFVRNAEKAKDLAQKGASVVQKDIFALSSADLQGFDVIINAFGEWEDFSLYKKQGAHLAGILADNKAHFLVVGGAWRLVYRQKPHDKTNGHAELSRRLQGRGKCSRRAFGAFAFAKCAELGICLPCG